MSELSTPNAIAQSVAQHSSDPFLVLVTIDHERLSSPLRACANNESVVSRGATFYAYPFSIELPSDGDDVPSARISLGNVTRVIGDAIEACDTAPSVTIEIVMASTPDTVERAWEDFQLTDVSWDAFRMTGTISLQSMHEEPWPGIIVNPKDFPGLFP